MQDNTNGQPTVSTPSSNNHRSKGLVIVSAIVGILVLTGIVGVGAYMLGKNQGEKASDNNIAENDTYSDAESEDEEEDDNDDVTVADSYEGWATYTNNDYGFSFKYPKDWEINEFDSSTTEWQAVKDSNSIGVTASNNSFEFTIVVNPYIEDFRSVLRGNVKNITVDGKNYKRILYHYADPDAEYIDGKPQLGELVFGHIMEDDNYQEDDWGDWFESSINIENKEFLILYDFPSGSTYDGAKNVIDIMDKIAESLQTF